MPYGFISSSRLVSAWWRSCSLPAASSSATKPCGSGRANSASNSPIRSVVAFLGLATSGIWLEQLTQEHNARLIVSDAIVAAIGNAAGTATKLGPATVKGYTEPVNIWRLG